MKSQRERLDHIETVEDSLLLEGTLTNEYGEFDIVVNHLDTKDELVHVTLLEDTSFAPKGDSSWVPIENVSTPYP